MSFAVERGQTLGLLGPNGAGKTTCLRMILGILEPTEGAIEVFGAPPGLSSLRDIGFLAEERGLYRGMRALDTVVYFGRLKGMTAAAARASARRLLDRFELGGEARSFVKTLSKGMAQKVQLATALVNAPHLILLDEPFSGLDPVNQAVIEDDLHERVRNGATLVFSTHVMQHAERLCDRLLVMARGRKVFEGTQEEARRTLPGRVALTAQGALDGLSCLDLAVAGGSEDGWTEWEVTLRLGADPAELLGACFDRGIRLSRFEHRRPSLHDIFLHLIGGAP
jgi:ABC-2 type transport system ATP-binding protein